MQGVNKVILIGRVGGTPELKYTPDGRPITRFSMATNRYYRDGRGGNQCETEWHRVVSFGRLAEICGQHLNKGRPVYVEGRLHTGKWEGKDGRTRSRTEVLCDTIQFLNAANANKGQPTSPILAESAAAE